MRRLCFSVTLFVIATATALPAFAQTQQPASVQTAALAVGPDLPKLAMPAPEIAPPGTIDVEPAADWIATGAPRSLQKL